MNARFEATIAGLGRETLPTTIRTAMVRTLLELLKTMRYHHRSYYYTYIFVQSRWICDHSLVTDRSIACGGFHGSDVEEDAHYLDDVEVVDDDHQWWGRTPLVIVVLLLESDPLTAACRRWLSSTALVMVMEHHNGCSGSAL
ncbi:hypothetical protein ACLOJK_006874 [Asimina triloba]